MEGSSLGLSLVNTTKLFSHTYTYSPIYERPATVLKNSEVVNEMSSFINKAAQQAAEDKLYLIASMRAGSSWILVRKTTYQRECTYT